MVLANNVFRCTVKKKKKERKATFQKTRRPTFTYDAVKILVKRKIGLKQTIAGGV